METLDAVPVQERYDSAKSGLEKLGLQQYSLKDEIKVRNRRATNTANYIRSPQSCDPTSFEFINYPILSEGELRRLAFRGLSTKEVDDLKLKTFEDDRDSIPSPLITSPGTASLLLLGVDNYKKDTDERRVQLVTINNQLNKSKKEVRDLRREKFVRKYFPNIAGWKYPGSAVA